MCLLKCRKSSKNDNIVMLATPRASNELVNKNIFSHLEPKIFSTTEIVLSHLFSQKDVALIKAGSN